MEVLLTGENITQSDVLHFCVFIICYTAVFSVVTHLWRGALGSDNKNGCVADYYLHCQKNHEKSFCLAYLRNV